MAERESRMRQAGLPDGVCAACRTLPDEAWTVEGAGLGYVALTYYIESRGPKRGPRQFHVQRAEV